MLNEDPWYRRRATERFSQARRQALRDDLTARLAGRDSHLLPFDAVRAELKQQDPLYLGTRQIPVAHIAGSVGRYQEFTRYFLPLNENLRERWVNVEAMAMARGWTPIEVYKVSDIYFVEDGNHRVAVARKMGNDTIEAHVWEFPAGVHIEADASLEEVLIRLGERNFMERTNLDRLRPEHGIRFTVPGKYIELLVQIEDLRQKLSIIDEEELSYQEAVLAWYEMVYLPIVQIIRDSTLLCDFPGRTESDLFVWLSRHREQLSELYGDYSLVDLTRIMAERYKEGRLSRMKRWLRRLLGREQLPPLQGMAP